MKRAKKHIGLVACILWMIGSVMPLSAQEEESPGLYFGATFGFHEPAGDLSDRFGAFTSAGASFEALVKQRWTFGVEGQFFFGSNVEENPLGDLITDRGQIITIGFTAGEVDVRMRGFQVFTRAGYIFDVSKKTSVSGPTLRLGVGYIRHQIRIREGQDGVPALLDPYLKGYDRSTDGIGLSQFVGYQHFDGKGQLNIFGGFEFTQGFTTSRRGFNYSTRMVDDASRVDMMLGIRLGVQVTIRQFGDRREIWY